jgi:hypothetical protein
MVTRREFLDALAVGAAGLAVGGTAKSYSRILGSNDLLNFAVIGLNGRAYAHLSSLKANRSAAPDCRRASTSIWRSRAVIIPLMAQC